VRLLQLALVLFCVLLAPACGSREEPAAGPTNTSTATTSRDALPEAVAKKKDAIVAAAHAFDYEGLEALLDPAEFTYSFGESGDPVGYWRRLEEEAEVPILGDYLPVILGAPFAKQKDIYVWPSAHAKKPSEWSARDRRWLSNLYTEDEIRGFEQAGSYLGWRVGIRDDGTWLFFVSGD
jgi:hypothetical protein